VIPEGSIPDRARKALIKAGILTISDLSKESKAAVCLIPGVGITSLVKCDRLLKSYGLPALH